MLCAAARQTSAAASVVKSKKAGTQPAFDSHA